jgi:large subunit ribosomal protein L13
MSSQSSLCSTSAITNAQQMFKSNSRRTVKTSKTLMTRKGNNFEVSAALRGRSLQNTPEGITIDKKGEDVFNKTYYPKAEDVDNSRKPWVVVDATDMRLGRMASVAATYLRGGNVATYHPSFTTGVNLVVINAEKVVVSGNKTEAKLYYNQSTAGKPGSMKIETFKKLQERLPERIVEKAIKGMLPKNRMGREVFRHLKVYKGAEHPHAAQNALDITADVITKCGGDDFMSV